MRDIPAWILVLTLFFLGASFYFKHRSTTHINRDGSCQSMTVEDDCY